MPDLRIVAAKLSAHEVIAAVANDDRVSAGIVGKHRNIVAVTTDDRCRWLMGTEAAAGDLEHGPEVVRRGLRSDPARRGRRDR